MAESGGRVGIVCHPRISTSQPPIVEAAQLLRDCGYNVWTYCATSEERPGALTENLDGTRLIVSFGGDGTMLWTAEQAAEAGIPILGVNAGRLGFLTQVQLGQEKQALQRWAAGDFTIQHRALLQVRAGARAFYALNDAMIDKGEAINFIRLEVEVDGQLAGRFDADGAIISTATGSTAYALSLGGPIVHPAVPALVFMPVNPHSLFQRAVVLPERARITIRVPNAASTLVCDGQRSEELARGAVVEISAGPRVQFVQFDGGRNFFELLHQKLRWGLPLIDGNDA